MLLRIVWRCPKCGAVAIQETSMFSLLAPTCPSDSALTHGQMQFDHFAGYTQAPLLPAPTSRDEMQIRMRDC